MAQDVIPFEGLTRELASAYQVEPKELIDTVKTMCFPGGAASDAQLFVFLTLAKQHDLSPFNREIYAFVSGGKLQTIVGFDGWIKMVNRHPQFAGFEFTDIHEDGKLIAVTCQMWRKDWSRAGEATEYFAECAGTTDPWKKWPHRMLRNKAYIQCARMTFGFAGIVDPDEAERIATPENWKTVESVGVVVEEKVQEGAGADSVGSPPAEPAPYAPVVEPEVAKEEKPKAKAKKTGEAGARGKLDKLIAEHVTSARLNLFLGQFGVGKVEELSDEQVDNLIQRIEKKVK